MDAGCASVTEFAPQKMLRKHDIFHLHWPEYYLSQRSLHKAILGSLLVLSAVIVQKCRGGKVIRTLHNLSSHRTRFPKLEAWFWTAFYSLVDASITLTNSGRTAAMEKFPGLRKKPCFVIPHGHYRGVYPDSVTRAEARGKLNIPDNAKLILFLGVVTEYKGVSSLLNAFAGVEDRACVLCIAGTCNSKSLGEQLRRAADQDDRIRLDLHWIPDDELQYFYRAADLVVLPFQDILNSGSALLALSFNVPLLAPAMGALPELQTRIGAEWIKTFDGILSRDHIVAALHWALSMLRAHQAPLESLDWAPIAAETLHGFASLASSK